MLVLGASSGFGSAVSIELAQRGFDVCGVHLDRRSTIESAERTRAAVEKVGRRALFFNVNACDPDKREEVLAEGTLSEGEVVRPVGQSPAAFVSLWLGAGWLHLATQDGEHWDAPSLRLTR